jgi:2-dehydro-3-deoxy-D-arabinonate dehydratase
MATETNKKLIRLYRASSGTFLELDAHVYPLEEETWDALIARDDLYEYLITMPDRLAAVDRDCLSKLLAPIGNQEVWAAGVTYYRSRDARMQESKSSGGGDFYDRVYDAPRPELFFKATPNRVVGPHGKVAIRDDASWSVPEPELALAVTPNGRIVGYTIGNDMSSRDIEGENPLYLPQAKVYDRSCGLGPCVLVSEEPMPPTTEIKLEIVRGAKAEFTGSTTLDAMKRNPASLVEYLYRNNSFPNGCFLLTGTGIVPPDAFTLQPGDEIRISITHIGTLVNVVG